MAAIILCNKSEKGFGVLSFLIGTQTAKYLLLLFLCKTTNSASAELPLNVFNEGVYNRISSTL